MGAQAGRGSAIATGLCRGMWARKSPRLGHSVRAFRSTSATATVPHSFAQAIAEPVWSKTADSIQLWDTSSYVLLTRYAWFSQARARARSGLQPQTGQAITSA